MKLEILIGLLSNLKIFGILSIVFVGIGLLLFTVFCYDNYSSDEAPIKITTFIKTIKFRLLIVFLLLVSVFPSMNQILEARITLIKLELSSPENIQKGVEEISRIGKALECKYLGCNEDKKE